MKVGEMVGVEVGDEVGREVVVNVRVCDDVVVRN